MSIVAGIGMTPNEKFAYNAGLRFYLLHPEQIIRPRITITYGTNAYIDVDKTIMENGKVTGRIRHNETAHGVNISAGARVMFGEEKDTGSISTSTSSPGQRHTTGSTSLLTMVM